MCKAEIIFSVVISINFTSKKVDIMIKYWQIFLIFYYIIMTLLMLEGSNIAIYRGFHS